MDIFIDLKAQEKSEQFELKQSSLKASAFPSIQSCYLLESQEYWEYIANAS